MARDILAGRAVAPGRALDEATALEAEADREAVDLQLGHVAELGHVLRGGRQAEAAPDPDVEGAQLVVAEGIAERQHRPSVADLGEPLAARRPTDALGRRIGGAELGERRLERDELAEQCVVLGVGELRRVVLVVEPVRPLDDRGELGVAGRRRRLRRAPRRPRRGPGRPAAYGVIGRARLSGRGRGRSSSTVGGPEEGERHLELLAQELEGPVDAGLAAGREGLEDRPADEHAARAEGEGDDDVDAAPDAAVDPDLGPARRPPRRPPRARRSAAGDPVELAGAVVRDDDRVGAVLDGEPGVLAVRMPLSTSGRLVHDGSRPRSSQRRLT